MGKILIVDDDKGIGEMLQMLLEMNDHQVSVSDNPNETNKNILNQGIDLVLLDKLISGVDGIDVCTQVKNNEKTKHVRVLMMSALHEAERKCKNAGADDFIAKPFEIDELLEKVNELLEN